MAYLIIWTILANTSTLNQRCFSVDIWLKISWAHIRSSTLFQRWQDNVDRITLIQRRWTNVVSTLKFGSKWNLSRRMFIDVVSTLKQHWQNYVDQRWWPNVVSTLIVSWKRNLSQRMFIRVASTLRKQHLNNFINCFTNVH